MPGTDAPAFRHLLLATDLSARCDRARDRAIELARAWGATLTVVHAVDVFDVPTDDKASGPALSEAAMRAARLMHADFGDVADVEISRRVGEGRPVDVVLDVAVERGCDLVITGIAGNDPFGRSLLGSTVAALTRRSPVPVLVVKKRPRGAYGAVLVASDLSRASAAALRTAKRLFRPEQILLFHAFDMPFRNWADDDRLSYERERRLTALGEIRAFAAEVAGEEVASAVRVDAAFGDPGSLVAERAAAEDADLVVAGTHGRTALMSVLLGSVAIALLDEAPCDVMIVPSEGARQRS